ncbi:MAG: ATP-binding cassette domain-containing protein [Chlorobi bacterium]|nr:ATP-binding cassette domain-containing protein [Chlorobiota bacterium]
MIEVHNINKSFEDNHVLKDISTHFEKGKVNLIIGRSGSGKTVFLKSLVGLQEVDSGEILFNGRDFTKMNLKQRKEIRKEIGMLFQGGALFDSETVEENIVYPMDMFTNMSLNEKIERANFCLNRVNIENSNQLFPAELSGGMQKRVAIARAIALNPKYLFCDEPNSGLDPITSNVIDKLIKDITEEFNITTIVNTHDMNSVMNIGDHIVFLYNGKKWWEGTNKEILHSDNKELNDFVYASELTKKLIGKNNL